jgi:hypothetical protein
MGVSILIGTGCPLSAPDCKHEAEHRLFGIEHPQRDRRRPLGDARRPPASSSRGRLARGEAQKSEVRRAAKVCICGRTQAGALRAALPWRAEASR